MLQRRSLLRNVVLVLRLHVVELLGLLVKGVLMNDQKETDLVLAELQVGIDESLEFQDLDERQLLCDPVGGCACTSSCGCSSCSCIGWCK